MDDSKPDDSDAHAETSFQKLENALKKVVSVPKSEKYKARRAER